MLIRKHLRLARNLFAYGMSIVVLVYIGQETYNLKRFNTIWTGCPDGSYGWLPVNPKFLGDQNESKYQIVRRRRAQDGCRRRDIIAEITSK